MRLAFKSSPTPDWILAAAGHLVAAVDIVRRESSLAINQFEERKMRKPAAVLAVLLLVSCTSSDSARQASSAAHDGPTVAMYRPEQMEWKDGPPSLLPGAKFVILEGDPTKEGYFAMRLKLPDGYKVFPHTHPRNERVTVIAGTLHLGMGATFDASKTKALPAGSYSTMQPGMQHFAYFEGETILQLATMGPWQINYVNPADDPRNKSR
jgi:hypothetical protein